MSHPPRSSIKRTLRELEVPEALIAPAKRGRGQPKIYTPELADELLERISSGETVSQICRDPAMPSNGTIANWRDQLPDFLEKYARAREQQAQVIAERAYQSSQDATPEDAAAARVKFDGGRWLAGKLAPRTYGDKTVIEGDLNVTHTLGDAMQKARDRVRGR
jgi:hypothetical protein